MDPKIYQMEDFEPLVDSRSDVVRVEPYPSGSVYVRGVDPSIPDKPDLVSPASPVAWLWFMARREWSDPAYL